jgi:thiol-disulfide isomerase/thioredoxin
MKRHFVCCCVVTNLLFLASAVTFAADPDREPAPRFHARTMTGQQYTNENLKGKVVLLEFWTTWCQYCRSEQEIIDDITEEFVAKGLVVLAVDVGESKKTVKKFLEANPRSCSIVLTEDTNLAAMYAATRYPIYVVIDRDGKIVDTQKGAAGERALRALLSRAGLESE